MQRQQDSHRRQQGATLIVAMVILVLIMMAGIAAVTSSSTQSRLAGNLQFEDTAMNSAEAAVAAAENWLQTGTNLQDGGFTTYAAATPHLYPIGRLAGLTAPANDPLTMTWSDTSSRQVAGDHQRFIIEQLSTNSSLLGSDAGSGEQASTISNRVNTYLVTARAQAPRGATKFVQSYFSVLVP